jgi:nucleoside-diphosphate-sugar epimerase
MRNGDVVCTASNCEKFKKEYGYLPDTNLADGVKYFVDWFKENALFY